ncbi:MAG: DUF4469 domain-containing protein [Treponema sp.]|nr:DUF4469 domain-containing protein [Treponema sp.]
MPRKKSCLLSLEKEKTKVDVVIHESNLPDADGSKRCYGSVSRRKVSVASILKEMEDNHASIMSKETMLYVAQELSRHMMDKLSKGCAVELLDFGTVYPVLKGSISRSDTPSKIASQFDVGFTPSEEARKAVGNLVVREVCDVAVQHYIFSVCELSMKDVTMNEVIVDQMVRINGKAIKLGGNSYGLYVAAVPEKWNGRLPAREKWIAQERIFTNMPSKIEFFLENVQEGTYVFIVETSLSAGGKPLKNSVIVHSKVVRAKGLGD